MCPELDIVQDSHSLKQFNVLKGPGYAQSSYLMGGKIGDILTFKDNTAPGRMVKSADTIQNTSLTSAVWPNDGKNFT